MASGQDSYKPSCNSKQVRQWGEHSRGGRNTGKVRLRCEGQWREMVAVPLGPMRRVQGTAGGLWAEC